ncbi:MAG: hypothetical protein WDO13_07795 [Verrucomicrobiota bacterium]
MNPRHVFLIDVLFRPETSFENHTALGVLKSARFLLLDAIFGIDDFDAEENFADYPQDEGTHILSPSWMVEDVMLRGRI